MVKCRDLEEIVSLLLTMLSWNKRIHSLIFIITLIILDRREEKM
jgi:hypothetical protein